MKELGFFMDNEGIVLYFGEWKEQYDKSNRHQIHYSSFEDEVEASPIFKSLNLQYNKDMGLYGKAINFALQGMVLMQNLTSRGKSQFIMHVPEKLTANQKESFTNLYHLLSSFEEAIIVIPKSIYITDDDKISSLDSYYELQEIPKSQGKVKWQK